MEPQGLRPSGAIRFQISLTRYWRTEYWKEVCQMGDLHDVMWLRWKYKNRVWKAAWVASRQLGCLRTIKCSHFRERSCSNSAKILSCFWIFSYGNITKRFCFPWSLPSRWRFTSFRDCPSLKVTLSVDVFNELLLYLLWGEIDFNGKKAELTERLVWSCLFLHTYKLDPLPRVPS